VVKTLTEADRKFHMAIHGHTRNNILYRSRSTNIETEIAKMSNRMFSDKSISYANPSMGQYPWQLSEACMRPSSVDLDNSNAYYCFIRGPGKSYGARVGLK
jgi:DNA-binding FadR family transcriptional regulator